MTMEGQTTLFSGADLQQIRRSGKRLPHTLDMSVTALQDWKHAIARYQHHERTHPPQHQPSLLTLDHPSAHASAHVDPVGIDPFSLQPETIAFWRFPANSPGDACLYFVIDWQSEFPLLLYVGETCRSNQRWKGEHDCKRYIANYQALHFQHGLTPTVTIAFWWDTPVQTRPRQQLELALIRRWRSPFNKENWEVWGTPFVGH